MMKLKAIAAAVALMATAGAANAAVQIPTASGGGGLIFEAWDSVTGTSFTQVLDSNTFDSAYPGAATGGSVVGTTSSGLNQIFNLASGFSSFASGDSSLASDIVWHVTAFKGVNDTTSKQGVLTSWGSTATPTINNNAVANAVSGSNTQYGNINTALGSNTSVVVTTNSDPAYAGKSTWGSNYGVATFAPGSGISGFFTGGIDAYTVYALGSGVGAFMSIVQSPTGTGTQASTKQLYGNAQGNAEWILQADGTLTYHLTDAAPAAVPLPAAAWLFGSGLMGLVSFARRRREKKGS